MEMEGDVDAAGPAWQKLLKLNHDLPQKDQAEQLIDVAKQSKTAVAEQQ